MQTTTYRKKLRANSKDEILLLAFTMFLLGLTQLFTRASDWPPFAAWGASEILSVTLLLFGLLVAAGFLRMALPRHNVLQLDEDGLTYKYASQSGVWPWREVSAFTLTRGWRGPRIEFTVSRDDGRWRVAPLRRTKAGLTGAIADIWDTPLDEIAATLNAYRDRALAGGADAIPR